MKTFALAEEMGHIPTTILQEEFMSFSDQMCPWPEGGGEGDAKDDRYVLKSPGELPMVISHDGDYKRNSW